MLDNFETNLKPKAEPGTTGEPLWACQDPAWDRCLARLATELVGTPSRVLITCRRPLAAVAGTASYRVRLGPLLPGEAALYLREHAGLGKMVFGGDASEKALAQRLLKASRFHPLLMNRLARLATGGPALRTQLMQVLTPWRRATTTPSSPLCSRRTRETRRSWPTWTTPLPRRSTSSSAMSAWTPAACCG